MRRKCRICVHYKHNGCVLDDQEPCSSCQKEELVKSRFLAFVVIVALAACVAAILWACKPEEEPEPVYQSAMELLRKQHRNDLTEWDKLVLAIAYTESRFRDDVVGTAGDSGILQITEPYVREANRVSGANFKHEDAFCVDSSLVMFAAIQDFYNPSHDIDQAIYRHNKSPQYKQTVLENLEMINRYEALRAKLIMTHY